MAIFRCFITLLLCAASPIAHAQSELYEARELYQRCQTLLDDDKPCDALKICREGLALVSNEALITLTDEAERACTREKKRQANNATHPPEPPEPPLDTDADGLPDDRDPCPRLAEDHTGPQPEDGCPNPDRDADDIVNERDACPELAEDFDAFRDTDGCPEPDNDGDGILDTDDACPIRAEDIDSFEDLDGCPDRDNDADGIADGNDICPDQAEDIDGDTDTDGCPDLDTRVPPHILTALISGSVLLVAGGALETVALLDRDAVLNPPTRNGVVDSSTQSGARDRLARSDLMQNIAIPTLGLGAAALTAGIVLYLLHDPTTDLEMSLSPTPEGGHLWLRGRF